MIFRVPSYYKEFRCKADRCGDSCCIGWEIDIDEDTFTYYKSVEGAFGERLAAHMVTEDGNSFVLQENGWCPFLNEKKLCDICIHLGEEALSEVCTEYPRFTMEYGNVREKILSLSCEEAGWLVFSTDQKMCWEEQEIPDDFACEECEGENFDDCGEETGAEESEGVLDLEEEDEVLAARLEEARSQAVAILQDRTQPVFWRAAEYLSFCEKMQQEIFGGREMVPGQSAVQDYQNFLARLKCYERLETLDDAWERVKHDLREIFDEENYAAGCREFLTAVRDREYEYEHLLVYFTFRYFMRAYYDDNILTKAQFAVASVLMIRDMDVMRYIKNGRKFTLADRIDTAKIYSKEVEHSEENMELLAEDFQFEEVFAPESMIRQL